MNDEHQVILRDSQLAGMVVSLSDWIELDPAPAKPMRSVRPGSCYSTRLMELHRARRLLVVQIEDDQRDGKPTASLEAELEATRVETSAFFAYLDGHARARP